MATCLEYAPGQYNDLKWDLLQKLLCATVNSGGGSGGSGTGANLPGVVDPGGVVTPDTVLQIYFNTATGTMWRSTGLTNADWAQVI